MASVQHLFGLGYNIPHRIIETAADVEKDFKEHYFAAVKIQALWRGYVVRQMVKKWNKAAIAIQRRIRGWLLRWHLPEYYDRYYYRLQLRIYNKKATIIQARWRGYWARKNLKILEHVKYELMMRKKNAEMSAKMKELFAQIRSKEREAEEQKKAVLFVLFKIHHILRTYVIEGILSLHGKKQLSKIEKLMKSVPMKNYMKKLRETYYKKYEEYCTVHEEKFENKKLQKAYALCRMRDKRNDLKDIKILFEEFVHEKPFDLSRKPVQYKYESPMLYKDKYVDVKKNPLERDFDKKKMISENDFDLLVYKKVQFPPKEPPYYIDLWYTQKCLLHHLEYLFE